MPFTWNYTLNLVVGILQVAAAGYNRQAVADHANNLATKIRGNLTNSMKGLGVDILNGFGSIVVSFQLVFGLSDHDEDRSVPQILGG